MAVLLTRPRPDNEATASALRARGFEVLLAPMLRFEPVSFRDEAETKYGGIIVTSANAVRAIEPQLANGRLLALPLFAVGEHTAAAARGMGFDNVMSADGDAAALRARVLASVRAKQLKKASALIYFSGNEVSRDLAGELRARGLNVVTQTVYRMVPLSRLPRDVCEAFAANQVDAVLHYSARSARAFLDAVRAEGVEISALAIVQCCISANVAAVLRDAGAAGVTVASSPDENALFAALERALRSGLA